MLLHEKALYSSENGDRWSLARDPDTGHVFVRQAQPGFGRADQRDRSGEFLVQGFMGLEKQALLRLIGRLVEEERPENEGRA